MTTVHVPEGAILLKEAQVSELCQIAPRTIRMMVSAGRFPKPIRLGKGQVHGRKRWLRSELDKWLAERLAERKRES